LRRQREGQAYKSDAGSVQNGTLLGYWIIPEAVELGFRSGLYRWKAKT